MRRKFMLLIFMVVWLAGLGQPGRAQDGPDSAYVAGVVGHPQTYSLSCESRSAVDWAAFWGVRIGEGEFLSGLPRSDNPDRGFVGNVHDAWGMIPPYSYGVHAEPVASRLREYGLEAEARRDLSWEAVRAEIAAGRPVIVWILGQMWGGTPLIYTANDGSEVRVAHFEHTMILVGYDARQVHVVDAYTGWTQSYPVGSFLASWSVLGNMAVVGGPPEPAVSEPPPQETLEESYRVLTTYTVEPGDTLAGIARRYGINWLDLANINGLAYPYVLHPGQVLKLVPDPQTADFLPVQRVFYPLNVPVSYRAYLPQMVQTAPTWQELEAARSGEPAQVEEAELPGEYVVQAGDYLIALAARFDLDWLALAERNAIAYPYVLYPGQVLRLR